MISNDQKFDSTCGLFVLFLFCQKRKQRINIDTFTGISDIGKRNFYRHCIIH